MLAEVNFRTFPVDLQSGPRIDHLNHLKTITELRLRNHVIDLTPLTELPELRYLELKNNESERGERPWWSCAGTGWKISSRWRPGR